MNLDGEITDCIVEGPISYDISISKKSLRRKALKAVAGEADLMIFHNISVANIVGRFLKMLVSHLCRSDHGCAYPYVLRLAGQCG